jgi:hypothetical protein
MLMFAIFDDTEQIGDSMYMTTEQAEQYREEMFNNLKRCGWNLKNITAQDVENYKKKSLKTFKQLKSKLSQRQIDLIIKSEGTHLDISKRFGISKSYVTHLKMRVKTEAMHVC